MSQIHHTGSEGFDYLGPDEDKETALSEKMGLLVTETFFAISRQNRFHTIPQCEQATINYLHKLIERVK